MKTGWEIKNLIKLLREENKGVHRKLEDYSKTYPLSAISESKDVFIIIRKFAARDYKGKMNMLNGPYAESNSHPISHYGMTIVSRVSKGASSYNIILPNSLKYQKLELKDDKIMIHYEKGKTVTTLKEINCLWTLVNLSKDDIIEKFNRLGTS